MRKLLEAGYMKFRSRTNAHCTKGFCLHFTNVSSSSRRNAPDYSDVIGLSASDGGVKSADWNCGTSIVYPRNRPIRKLFPFCQQQNWNKPGI